ncbi:uncharacterized protein LOC107265513 isoform X2 [Cephus cinctus]|uniref:Uncharacterized protein LOC107265513 isoform X2 n=1 Tax=Cephus cinctus TaxID=211228 RepID=A0AAJ7FGD8_CEPCN|nr:uncharacterized protein LOC107265513 isoform X2 [Cephus cinctus]
MDNEHLKMEKLKESFLLLKKKMCRSHDLIQQYNDKLKECERLKIELDTIKEEASKIKRNYNNSLAKVIKLELQNTDFKKNIEILTNTISSYETTVAGDQKYSQQLVCKMTDMEEKHSEKIMEIELEKSALQVKVKGLEQEIKAIKKAHETELKKKDKKISQGEETKKKMKIQSPPSLVLPPSAVIKTMRDVAVNTTPIELTKHINTMEQCIQTNEFNGNKNNPYALFCDNCEKMFDSPPYHKICNIMTKCPPLITKLTSLSQISETNKQNAQCTLTPMAVKRKILSPETSQSQLSPKTERQNDSTSVIEMLQKKIECLERQMKRHAKKSARTPTDCCSHHHPTYYPPNSFPGFSQQDVFSQFWKRILEFSEQQASESQTQIRGQKRKQGKLQCVTKIIPKKRRKALKSSRKWIVESVTPKNEDEESDSSMASTSNQRSSVNKSQTACTPLLSDNVLRKTDKDIDDELVMIEKEKPNSRDSLETEAIMCQNDVLKVQTNLNTSNLVKCDSVLTNNNDLSSDVTYVCSKRQKVLLPENQEIDNESVTSFPSGNTEVIFKMLEDSEKQSAKGNNIVEFLLKNENGLDANNTSNLLSHQTNLQDNLTYESMPKILSIEDENVNKDSKMSESNSDLNESPTGRSTPYILDELAINPSNDSIKNTVSSCQLECQDSCTLPVKRIQSKTSLLDVQETNTANINFSKSPSNMTVKSFASITRLFPVTIRDIYSDTKVPEKTGSNITRTMQDVDSNNSKMISQTFTKTGEVPDASTNLEDIQGKIELPENHEKLSESGTITSRQAHVIYSAETNLQKCNQSEMCYDSTSLVVDVMYTNDSDSSITESDFSSHNEIAINSIDRSPTDKSLKNIASIEKRDDYLINQHHEISVNLSEPTLAALRKRKRIISPRKASLRNAALFGDDSFDDEPPPACKLQAISRLRGNQETDKDPKKMSDLEVAEDKDMIVEEFEKPIEAFATNSEVLTSNKKNKQLEFYKESLKTIACLNCISGVHKDSPVALLSKHLEMQLEQKQKGISEKKSRTTKREAYEMFVTAQLNALAKCDDSMNVSIYAVIEKLSQSYRSRSVAKCVVNFLCETAKDDELLDRTYTPPAPLMTKVQQKIVMLLVSLKRIDPSIFNMIQTGIEYKIFRLGHAPEVNIIETLVRVYTVLSRIAKDREKVRILCCDALYCLRLKAIPIIYVALTCWPEVFPTCVEHQDILPKCIAHLVLSQQATGKFPRLVSTKNLFTTYYKCPKAGYLSTDLAIQFLTALQETRHSGLNTAIILLSKREGTTWAYKHIVRGGLLQMIVNNNHPSSYEAFYLLGKIMRSFPIKDDGTVGDIVEQLCDLIDSGKVTHEQEEGVVSALLSLARHKFTEVATSVLKWKPSKPLRPRTVEQLQIFYSIHPVQWWARFIKGHSAAIGKMIQ